MLTRVLGQAQQSLFNHFFHKSVLQNAELSTCTENTQQKLDELQRPQDTSRPPLATRPRPPLPTEEDQVCED